MRSEHAEENTSPLGVRRATRTGPAGARVAPWIAPCVGAILACGLFVGSAAAQSTVPPDLPPATIRMLQHSLMQGGYAVDSTDGVWGPRTAAAVREFQRVKGLQATGRPDAQTLAALGVPSQGGEPVVPIRKRTPGDLARGTIRAIQQALDRLGLQTGPVDGVWGDRTVSAIGNLQRSRGMPASGELDAHTLAALGLLPTTADRAVNRRPGQPLGPADLDPAAIRMIQQSLGQRGYLSGVADGLWGENTANALRAFQRAQGIEPLGEPDVYTLSALGLLPS